MKLVVRIGNRVILESQNGRFWVVLREREQRWYATHYPPFKTIEEAQTEFVRGECGANAPAWLVAGWRKKLIEGEAARAQAAATSP